jgi:hypothetical protein
MARTRSSPPICATIMGLLTGCSAVDPPPAPLAWYCADGGMLRVLIEDEKGRAVLSTSEAVLTLVSAPAGRGRRFVSPGWEFWAVDEEALFIFPGGRETRCRYQGGFPS